MGTGRVHKTRLHPLLPTESGVGGGWRLLLLQVHFHWKGPGLRQGTACSRLPVGNVPQTGGAGRSVQGPRCPLKQLPEKPRRTQAHREA